MKKKNPGVLRRLSKDTGGIAFFPISLEGVADISKRIARDLREQYTLGFVPGEDRYHGFLSANTRQGRCSRPRQVSRANPARLFQIAAKTSSCKTRKECIVNFHGSRCENASKPKTLLLRAAYYVFLAGGVFGLGYAGYVIADAHIYQTIEQSKFEKCNPQ